VIFNDLMIFSCTVACFSSFQVLVETDFYFLLVFRHNQNCYYLDDTVPDFMAELLQLPSMCLKIISFQLLRQIKQGWFG